MLFLIIYDILKGSGKDVEVVTTIENEPQDMDIFDVRVDEDAPAIEDQGKVDDGLPVPLPLVNDEYPVEKIDKNEETKKTKK